MTTIDEAAELDRQIADLLAVLEALIVPDLDPHLAETVLAAIAAVKLRGDRALAGRVFVAIGDTHTTIRGMLLEEQAHQRDLAARLVQLEETVAVLLAAREVGR